MTTKHEQRSEETKRSIVAAAGRLFADRGFDGVTMREIAKEAGCSHTTIYLYYKDKEALLHQLCMPPLEEVKRQFEAALQREDASAEQKLQELGREFIRCCLQHRSLYAVLFTTRAVRVDEKEPELAINRLRNQLFGLMQTALQQCLPAEREEQALANARIYFFMLHGIVATYAHSEETAEGLMERLVATFDEAFDVVMAGLRHTRGKGADGK
ncbi:TetR/AcrR family transcriptional regulator [Paenibacillus cymbidii]|uniref:TetR/AcrR family transcriptional regulator n=1 Tax=Paenibacillus cymbidii TaxID=1639034 RepID=UPI001081A8A4|nr:TetR/AcrR family transcriptional regulator [Paenibacillus cymbidii]